MTTTTTETTTNSTTLADFRALFAFAQGKGVTIPAELSGPLAAFDALTPASQAGSTAPALQTALRGYFTGATSLQQLPAALGTAYAQDLGTAEASVWQEHTCLQVLVAALLGAPGDQLAAGLAAGFHTAWTALAGVCHTVTPATTEDDIVRAGDPAGLAAWNQAPAAAAEVQSYLDGYVLPVATRIVYATPASTDPQHSRLLAITALLAGDQSQIRDDVADQLAPTTTGGRTGWPGSVYAALGDGAILNSPATGRNLLTGAGRL